ncbi:MAG: D-tyrosyl-tRNA(Tyr) deacylase [Cellulomonadaceae bacterium]|jgi:D-tyrosyl-tRNA(Tyr) deacylase|nr:D-tyrosyl-tRNA(Tyr) deacylase [Cellulomonadaceae bacterium]
MRAVLQRATKAKVTVAGEVVGEITRPGIVALVGVTNNDTIADAHWLARKIAELRIMREENSVSDINAPVLVISQFTLYGDARKGRRPSWSKAAPGPVAEPLVDAVCAELRARNIEVVTGQFGADMAVELTNDGPFTVILDSLAQDSS